MKNKVGKIIVIAVMITMFGTSIAFASDVPSDVKGKACETAVTELMDAGVITGDTDGLFHPESELTRAQVCIMIAKAIDSAGINDSGYIQAGKKFKDMDGYNWAAGAIGFMASKKMAKGYPNGNFRPGEKVTVAELITFGIRACGEKYSDENLGGTWPENYIAIAKNLGLIKDVNIENIKTQTATKSDAAIIVWKALGIIKESQKEEASKDDKSKDDKKYTEIDGYRFGDIKFDNSVTKINDLSLSNNAVIYAYGKASEYNKKMSIPASSKLTKVDIRKYPNVSTKALYKVVNGYVTEIILPENCGFSGKAYGVINAAELVDTDNGEAIAFTVLTAGKELVWQTNESKVSNALANENSYIWDALKQGELFELKIGHGKITDIKIGNQMVGKFHNELTDGSWTEISKDAADEETLVFSGNKEEIEISQDAVVYIYNLDTEEYEISTLNDVWEGYYVRAYDVSDNDEDSADIILAVEQNI